MRALRGIGGDITVCVTPRIHVLSVNDEQDN